jgi:hypothetical protein
VQWAACLLRFSQPARQWPTGTLQRSRPERRGASLLLDWTRTRRAARHRQQAEGRESLSSASRRPLRAARQAGGMVGISGVGGIQLSGALCAVCGAGSFQRSSIPFLFVRRHVRS